MRRMLMVLCCVVLASAQLPIKTQAAVGPGCNLYDYQEDAQADFERLSSSFPNMLDENGDGIACNNLLSKPELLTDTQRLRGDFARDSVMPTVEGLGYSNRYEVALAFTTFASPMNHMSVCPDLASSETLFQVFEIDQFARSFYTLPADGTILPEDTGDQRVTLTGLVWTVFGDPTAPALLNEWLILNGLAYYEPPVSPSATVADRLLAAEEEAKAEQRGVWGQCAAPDVMESNTTLAPPGSVVFESSSGDQIVPFELFTDATYQLNVDIYGSSAVFVAVDVYHSDGTWIPELSVTSAETGSYSSAGSLDSGSYFIQVKAVGSWRVTLTPLRG